MLPAAVVPAALVPRKLPAIELLSEFSAEIVESQKTDASHAKIYFGKDKIRVESANKNDARGAVLGDVEDFLAGPVRAGQVERGVNAVPGVVALEGDDEFVKILGRDAVGEGEIVTEDDWIGEAGGEGVSEERGVGVGN